LSGKRVTPGFALPRLTRLRWGV